MTVTEIKKKRKGLSALFIDYEYALDIDTETLLSYRIDVGAKIDDETLKELIDHSNINRAKDKAMWLISYRDYSKKEITEKVAKESSTDAAEKAVERLCELGLINDEKYAKRYAHDLIFIKHLSRSGAIRKLREKGIDKELAEITVEEFDVDYCESIKAIIDKKYAKYLLDEKGKRRCVNGLLRLGYSYSDINSVLREYTDTEYYE